VKKIVLLGISFVSAAVYAFATDPAWSSFVDSWQNYSPTASDPASTEISAFTPEREIIVSRIEIDAHIGPLNNSTTPFSACATNPSLTLKGGTKTYTLELTTPPNVSTAFHSYTDSGPLRLAFGAGTKLTLVANPGDANCVGGNEVNIVLHYHNQDENQDEN